MASLEVSWGPRKDGWLAVHCATSSMRLETERLMLREWQANELDAMYRWHGDPAVTRYLMLTLAIAEQTRVNREYVYLAIELKTSSRVSGDAGFHWIVRGNRGREMGYFLEPAYWGHGYATEAARTIQRCGFENLGATQMRASCDERNSFGAGDAEVRNAKGSDKRSTWPTSVSSG